MATLKVFALLDMKAGFFQVPFFMPSVGQAVRAVSDMAADQQTIIGRHPGDFELYQLGDWDDATAAFTPTPPQHIADGEAMAPAIRVRDQDGVRYQGFNGEAR